MATGTATPPVPKRFKPAPYECMLDCRETESDPSAKLISPVHYNSWETLLRAAEIRKHSGILDLTKNLGEREVPNVWYHRKCRSHFTLKKLLDRIVAQNESQKSQTQRTNKRSSGEFSRLYELKCIFCEKDQFVKNSKTRTPLVQCRELRADNTIRDAVVRKMDERVLAFGSRDLVAAEGHYHRKCYRNYPRPGQGQVDAEEDHDVEDMNNEGAVDIAKRDLFSFVRQMFTQPCVIPMVQLTCKLTESLATLGFTIELSTKKHIRRMLEMEFNDTLHFVNEDNGALLVFPTSLTVDSLVKDYQAVRKELEIVKSNSDDSLVPQAALAWHQAIKSQEISKAWPPDTSISRTPEVLIQFYHTLLTGEGNCSCPSEWVQRLTTSFSQDLVYAVTNGLEKSPKHVFLQYAIKSLTGNVELIHTLNRFGHGISYSKLEEVEENDMNTIMEYDSDTDDDE